MQATGRGEYQLAVLPLGLGPHAAQSLQMDVDGPGPQLTAAGHGHLHPPEAVQRRGQVKHRAAHGAGRAVRQDTTALSVGGPQAHRRPLTLCLPAQRSVNGKALFHIRQRRRLPDDRFSPAQHAGRDQRQHTVFCRRHHRLPEQRSPARDLQILPHINRPFFMNFPIV